MVPPPDGLEGAFLDFLFFLTSLKSGISDRLILLVAEVTFVTVLVWFRYVYSVGDFFFDTLLTSGLRPFLPFRFEF